MAIASWAGSTCCASASESWKNRIVNVPVRSYEWRSEPAAGLCPLGFGSSIFTPRPHAMTGSLPWTGKAVRTASTVPSPQSTNRVSKSSWAMLVLSWLPGAAAMVVLGCVAHGENDRSNSPDRPNTSPG